MPSSHTKPFKKEKEQLMPFDLPPELSNSQLVESVLSYYHFALKDSPEALAYLEERNLGDADFINTFNIGYANRTLSYHIPDRTRAEKQTIRQQLKNLGLLRLSGWEYFQNCLIFPLSDIKGNVSAIYGLKMHAQEERLLRLPFNQAECLFNRAALSAKEVILAGTALEAMTLWVAGQKNVFYSFDDKIEKLVEILQSHAIEKALISPTHPQGKEIESALYSNLAL
jgi:hypothetical protein